jgi:hypothetical protein
VGRGVRASSSYPEAVNDLLAKMEQVLKLLPGAAKP